ncbi:MAG: carbonic anhydrase [Actinomycetota bacterium]|jgi:carbonic anhydrase
MNGAHHGCRAAVLTCIDYRFVQEVREFLAAQGLEGKVDLVAWPGGALALGTEDREQILQTLELSRRLHHSEEIMLTAHWDCGRVGGSAAFAGPDAERLELERGLAFAAGVVVKRIPGVHVRLVKFGDGETVELDSI